MNIPLPPIGKNPPLVFIFSIDHFPLKKNVNDTIKLAAIITTKNIVDKVPASFIS